MATETALINYDQRILRIYFNKWKRRMKSRKENQEMLMARVEQREKLDNLIKALENRSKNAGNNQETATRRVKSETTFTNRFNAQKTTIEKLTLKLEAKDRLIEELKLGILRKETFESLDNSKIEIREIFKNCSAKVRCKLVPPTDYTEKFMVSTQKAPKIVQQMEERALKRAMNHQIILERKRVIDETRKRILAEALENKRIQDEVEKRKALESIKERRRKELELEKVRQANKLVFMKKLDQAEALYNKKLIQNYFRGLVNHWMDNKNNLRKSELHYKTKLVIRCWYNWKLLVESKYEIKYMIADEFYEVKVKERALLGWKEFYRDCVRSMQVAEDFYDLQLQSRIFVHWHRYVCIQYVQQDKKLKLAEKHYKRRLIFNCFYQWRSLPAILQLERAKEAKKKRWRERVWEVLPDYTPPTDDLL